MPGAQNTSVLMELITQWRRKTISNEKMDDVVTKCSEGKESLAETRPVAWAGLPPTPRVVREGHSGGAVPKLRS